MDFIRPLEYNKKKRSLPFVEAGVEMEYMTASQAAHKWNISQRRVQILCSDGRIPGVFKLGETWAIPIDSVKPRDQRKKGGNENEKL